MAGSSRYLPRPYFAIMLLDSGSNALNRPFYLETWNVGATGNAGIIVRLRVAGNVVVPGVTNMIGEVRMKTSTREHYDVAYTLPVCMWQIEVGNDICYKGGGSWDVTHPEDNTITMAN